MQQYSKGIYTRQYIADMLNLDINDTRHFKRNVENKLRKWGYDVDVRRREIEITKTPESAEEKLSELFIREFDIDVRTNIYGMACFLVELAYYEDFQSMPWDVRAEELYRDFKVRVDKKTLYNWFKKLEKRDLTVKFISEKTTWVSYYVAGDINREMVTGNDEYEHQARNYFKKRNQYVKEYRQREIFENNREDISAINSEAWKFANKMLWDEFHCRYYTCYSIYLNAIGEYAQEIFELVEEISGINLKY